MLPTIESAIRALQLLIVILALSVVSGNSATAADRATIEALPRFLPETPLSTDGAMPISVRFVTSDDFPPFSFLDGDGRLTGYNVELARAICVRLAVPCTLQVRPFAELAKALAENEADAAIAGLTEKAGDDLLFTEAYLRLPARFVARSTFEIDPVPETMTGRRIVVERGTRHADFLKDFFAGAVIVETDSAVAAFEAMRKGEADAAFSSALPAVFWLTGPEALGCCHFVGGAYTEPAYVGKGLKIAVAKDNVALRDVLDRTLGSLEGAGVLADLNLRFFPESLY